MTDLVSIIIPVKDRIEWLIETLDSVFNQTYPNIEVIVVDDGSSPPVRECLPTLLERSNVKILRNESSQGVGAAREKGRLTAQGSYINYLDSDDLLHRDKIKIQVNALQKSKTAGMCYCTCIRFRDIPISGKEPVWNYSDKVDLFSDRIDLVLFRPWVPGACLWTRKATDAIGPWADLFIGDDTEYDLRAGCLGIDIIKVPDILFYYRRSRHGPHGTNKTESRRINYAISTITFGRTASNYVNVLKDEHIKLISKKLEHSFILFLILNMKPFASECNKVIRTLHYSNRFINLRHFLLKSIIFLFPSAFVNYLYRRSRWILKSS